jgi:hypothetical protein
VSIVSRDPHDPITAEQWDALRERWPHADRIKVAFALASDIDTCAALLRGEPVDPDRLDPERVAWAREHRLVQLDLAAIDLLPHSVMDHAPAEPQTEATEDPRRSLWPAIIH